MQQCKNNLRNKELYVCADEIEERHVAPTGLVILSATKAESTLRQDSLWAVGLRALNFIVYSYCLFGIIRKTIDE